MSIESFSSTDQYILRHMGLTTREDSNFSPEAFISSYHAVEQRLKEAGAEKLDYQTRCYVDAFSLPRDRDYTLYEDEFNMPPPLTMRTLEASDAHLPSSHLSGGANAAFHPQAKVEQCYEKFHSVAYGAMTMYNIPPTGFIFVPRELIKPNDVIGSDAFSSCTAIVVRTRDGIFYAHVTTEDWGVKEVLAAAKKFFPGKEILVVRPEYKREDGKNEEYEKRWKFLDHEKDVRVEKYPYIAADSVRTNQVNEFSILVTDSNVRVIGRHVFPNNKREFDFEAVSDIKY